MIVNKKIDPIKMEQPNYSFGAATAASVTSGCSVVWNEQEYDLDILMGGYNAKLDIGDMDRILQRAFKNYSCYGDGDRLSDNKTKSHDCDIDTDLYFPDPFESSIPLGEVNLGSCAPFRDKTKSMPDNNTSALLDASNYTIYGQYETRLNPSTPFDDEHSIHSNINNNTNTMLNTSHDFPENQLGSFILLSETRLESLPSQGTRIESSNPVNCVGNTDSNHNILLHTSSYFTDIHHESTLPSPETKVESSTPHKSETKSKFKRPRKKRYVDLVPFHSICPLDVLMGQGVTLQMKNQPGNLRYRELTDANYENYDLASDKTEKTKLSEAIVSEIVRDGGRFLKPHSVGGVKGWKILNDLEARKKVAYTFRGIRKRKLNSKRPNS